MGLTYPVRLRSIDQYIIARNGRARDLSLTEIDVLDYFAGEIVGAIEDEWPVDTSTSRDAFAFTLDVQIGAVGFVIENDIDYVQYIHRSGETAVLWAYLIPEIIQAYAPQMLAAMRRAVDVTQAALVAQAGTPPGMLRLARRGRG
jgi:hypothetical protein